MMKSHFQLMEITWGHLECVHEYVFYQQQQEATNQPAATDAVCVYVCMIDRKYTWENNVVKCTRSHLIVPGAGCVREGRHCIKEKQNFNWAVFATWMEGKPFSCKWEVIYQWCKLILATGSYDLENWINLVLVCKPFANLQVVSPQKNTMKYWVAFKHSKWCNYVLSGIGDMVCNMEGVRYLYGGINLV